MSAKLEFGVNLNNREPLIAPDYDLQMLLDLSERFKRDRHLAAGSLGGGQVGLIFNKPSTRTRVSFEAAAWRLGMLPIALRADELQLGRGETIADTARTLSRYLQAIVIRTHSHASVLELAEHASIPVINALTDEHHPCQALADYFTLWERGIDLASTRLAWIGDGNNVCHSVLLAGALVGTSMVVACPPGYEPNAGVQATVRKLGGRLEVTHDAREAATGADVLYTDVWVSMGQEAERVQRTEAFNRYQLNDTLVGFAKPSVLLMHCLPAHRGEEITDPVLDGPRSIVLEQSENRLHAQKAVIFELLGGSLDDA